VTARLPLDAGADAPKTLVTRLWGPAVGLPGARERFGYVAVLLGLLFLPMAYACIELKPSQTVTFGLFAAWFAVMLLIGLAMLVPTRLVLGADGLHFTWLGSSRFLPYAEIRVVHLLFANVYAQALYVSGRGTSGTSGVQITLVHGEVVPVEMSRRADLVYGRIAEAVDAWWRRDGAVQTALVQRGPRDPRGWLRALRGIGAKVTSDYRSASMADELWRIVEDVAAPADARAGAAVALRGGLGAEGRDRLRRIAGTTAFPRLRIAIVAAANERDDEDALAAALAEVAEPEGQGKRVASRTP
jgi:hypothetical protein